jgi:hypothetical protein
MKKTKIVKNFPENYFFFFAIVAAFLIIPILLYQNNNQEANAATTTTQFGFNFSPQWTVPTLSQYQALNPQWVRFGVVLNANYPFVASSIKKLVLFNQEETTDAPQGSTNVQAWDTYVTNSYIPKIKTFLAQHPDTAAIEVWNEEDNCPGGGCVPTQAYAYMIKNTAKAIKSINGNIKVIMGGLESGNTQYIKSVKSADSRAFSQVDAIGFHPYGKSPAGWCAKGCSGGTLPFGDLATAINQYKQAGGLPIWITEIGTNSTDQNWQAQYEQRIFTVFKQTGIPVAIWYTFNDGGGGPWGLVDVNGNLKPSGNTFRTFNVQPTPMQ